MPQQFLIALVGGLVVPFVTAAAIVLICGWPWRSPRPVLTSIGVIVGTGIGLYSGYLVAEPFPPWPPTDDAGRFLLLVFPAVLMVELAAAFLRRQLVVTWLLRGLIAAGAGRVLLHDSTYLKDAFGDGTAEWSPATALLILSGLAAALWVVWLLLDWLMRRSVERAVPIALILALLGSSAVGLMSSYVSPGLLAMNLALSLSGVVAASSVLARGTDLRALLGPGLVGLFSTLFVGHFFGNLSASSAILLFAAPLACWIPELVPAGRNWTRLRMSIRIALVSIPVAFAVAQGVQALLTPEQPAAVDADAPSAEDYANFGR
jgi:hypothetical protein